MIQGYEIGTKVKWNDSNSLETGVVEEIFSLPLHYEVNGHTIFINATEDSPYYLIHLSRGGHIVLSHEETMLKQVNSHT